MGYEIAGNKSVTKNGFQILLKRQNFPSLFGNDIIYVKLEVFFYSDSLLRFKVSLHFFSNKKI